MTDFTMYSGDSLSLRITIADDEDGDLDGAEVRWWMGRSANAAATLKKDNLDEGGLTVEDSANRIVVVQIDPGDTESLRGEFYHEVEVTDSSGNISTVMTGTATITPVIIRPED